MMKNIVLILLFAFNSILAQNNQELFESANAMYKNGQYQEAVKAYEDIIAGNEISSELFYNLGNSYYKLNKVAPAIFNYEKALQLDPSNEDANNNLIYAKRLTIDRIEELPKSVFQRFSSSYLQKMHYNNWGALTIVFAFLAVGLFLLFYFSLSPFKKRLLFTLSMLSVLFLITSFSIAFHLYRKEKNTKEAIVFSEQVSVQTEPTNNANEAFVIHEGTKVFVLDAVDDWNKIKLADGKIGWLKNASIKELSILF